MVTALLRIIGTDLTGAQWTMLEGTVLCTVQVGLQRRRDPDELVSATALGAVFRVARAARSESCSSEPGHGARLLSGRHLNRGWSRPPGERPTAERHWR